MSWFSDAFKKIGRFLRRALAILAYVAAIVLYLAAIVLSVVAVWMGWNPIGWLCAGLAAVCLALAWISVNLAQTIDQVDQLMSLPSIVRWTLTFTSLTPWAGSYADADAVTAVQSITSDIDASELEEQIYSRALASITMHSYPRTKLVDLTTGEVVATAGDDPTPTRGDEPVSVEPRPTNSNSGVAAAAIAGVALLAIATGDDSDDNQSN